MGVEPQQHVEKFIKRSNFSSKKTLDGHFGGSKHTFKRKKHEQMAQIYL